MSTSYCSCTLPSSLPRMLAMRAPPGRLEAADCPKQNTGENVAKNILNQTFMGFPALMFKGLDQEPDTSALDEVDKQNDALKDAFQRCNTQFMNCRLQQSLDFMQANLDVTKSLQSITDEIQNQKIDKNQSLIMYAIGMIFLIMVYIFSMPTPLPT